MIQNILIVEDDVLISEHLKMIIENFGYRISSVCPSLKSAENFIQRNKPDFAFVDIRLNGKDEGIEVGKIFNKLEIPFSFVSSFSDKNMILEATLQKPIAYLVKPFTADEINLIIKKAEEIIKSEYLLIGNSQKIERIKIKNINWLRSENVYVEIITADKKYVTRDKLSNLNEKLPQQHFVRINQSYIVNLEKISKIQNNSIFINGSELPLSRKYRKNVL